MNMAGNKTNDFYAQLEPYVNSGEGAVSSLTMSCYHLVALARRSQTLPQQGRQHHTPQQHAQTCLFGDPTLCLASTCETTMAAMVPCYVRLILREVFCV